MNPVNQGAVNRLARLLTDTTEDARQLIAAGETGERLHRQVKLAAALSAELGRVLKLVEQEGERVNRAAVIAEQVIDKARSASA